MQATPAPSTARRSDREHGAQPTRTEVRTGTGSFQVKEGITPALSLLCSAASEAKRDVHVVVAAEVPIIGSGVANTKNSGVDC